MSVVALVLLMNMSEDGFISQPLPFQILLSGVWGPIRGDAKIPQSKVR